jgi:GH18 family chitinase
VPPPFTTFQPQAPDLPNILKGSPDEPGNYLKFLQLVKSKLPSDKSLSIAAPASFWYLKQFPIAAISRTVDYIVHTTYDLHGMNQNLYDLHPGL